MPHPVFDYETRQWFIHNDATPDDLSDGYNCRSDAEAACEEREDEGE